MALLGMTTMMILALIFGRRSKEFGLKQFVIIALLAFIQVFLAAYDMWKKPFPPLH